MRWLWLVLWVPVVCYGELWNFGEPVDVTNPALAPHYHHLDGSGRRHLAAAGDHLAVVWEDDRTGSPQVYVAIKGLADLEFRTTFQISTGAEAYAPVIVPAINTTWVVAWEQDGQILGSLLTLDGPTTLRPFSLGVGRQVTLATDGSGRLFAIWAKRKGSGQRLVMRELGVGGGTLTAEMERTIVHQEVSNHQAYPAADYAHPGKLFIAWEDRRAGHTRLFGILYHLDGTLGPEIQLNEHREPAITESYLANKGTGAMRVSVASGQDGWVEAVWLDKRHPGSGYAVWGARSVDGGHRFGVNGPVQDTMGDAVAQWHVSVASIAGGFVAVWDDARENWSDEEETGDVILAWRFDEDWSDDWIVPGASGSGYQGSPVVAQDRHGDLHLVWIEKMDLTSPSQLKYLRGARVK